MPPPLIITTSTGMAEVTTRSPLLSRIFGRDMSTSKKLPACFMAVASEGLFEDPKKQVWGIDILAKGLPAKTVQTWMSYDEMTAYMREREAALREKGATGSDEDIIAVKQTSSSYRNILRFI